MMPRAEAGQQNGVQFGARRQHAKGLLVLGSVERDRASIQQGGVTARGVDQRDSGARAPFVAALDG
jgi:hypothetical protein